jgi:hypothetical protein
MKVPMAARAASAHSWSLEPLNASKDRSREHRRAHEVGDVEDDDVPARSGAKGFRDESDRNRDRRKRRRQDEDGGEDRREGEVRALVLLTFGPHQVHGGDDREEHREGEPLVAGDLLRPPCECDPDDHQPDDDELDRSGRGAQAPIPLSHGRPASLERMVAETATPRIPSSGDEAGGLDPSNE